MHSLSKMTFVRYLTSLCYFINLSTAGYVLKDDYNPSVFFDMFDFWTSSDPTNGFVQYVDQDTARTNGYITNSTYVYIGTDHTKVQANGRPSIRLTSKAYYNSGSLVILDLAHMPAGICGTWPAFWMVGPNWPNSGEIDIIEGVNLQTTNAMTLHTSDGCAITDNGNFTGTISTDDCYIYADDQSTNAGCSIATSSTNSYGTGFNNIGGGVYAMEWTDEAISIWFFPRTSIPSDIAAASLKPQNWGTPMSQFQGCCDIPEYFENNQIVFDLTYCGDWAGNVWSSSSCSSLASTCNSYVANNPTAFKNAYWNINSLRVYNQTTTAAKVASSSTSKKTTSTKRSTSAAKTTTKATTTPKKSTSSKKTSTTSQKVSTSSKKSSTSSKKLSSSSKKSSTSSKKISTSSKKASTSSKKISTSSKKASTSSKKASTSSKKVTTAKTTVKTTVTTKISTKATSTVKTSVKVKVLA